MKNNTNKFVGSLGGVATFVMLVAALLFLAQGTVALAEGVPGASNSSNTPSGGSTGGGSAAPAGSGSGNTGAAAGAPGSSNSGNTGSTGGSAAPAGSGSGNTGAAAGAPGSSNSSNTTTVAGGAPGSSNSGNTTTATAPGSSNSSNSTNNPAAAAPAPAPTPASGPVGGGANGAPANFSFGPGNSFVPITMPGSQPIVVAAPVVNNNVGGAVATGGTSCAPYLNDFLAPGVDNASEVTKLQAFLSEQGFSVDVNGIYDEKTTQAVSDFQLKYSDDVLLKSWGASIPSGVVYITTKLKINDLACNHKSDFSSLSYLGRDLKAQVAEGNNGENVAGSGATVASGTDDDSTDEEGGTQEASVAKTSGGFFSKIGNWFTSVFKKNK